MPLDVLSLLAPRRPNLVWRDLHWPAEFPAEHAVAILRQLATDHYVKVIVFEVEATAGQVLHRLGVGAESLQRVEQLFAALLPNSATTTGAKREELEKAWRVALNTPHRPLATAEPESVTRAVLAALASAKADEKIVLQWLLGRSRAPRPVRRRPPQAPSTAGATL